MGDIVIDASLILKLAVVRQDEDYIPEALNILERFIKGEFEIAVPSIWKYEVGNRLLQSHPEVANVVMKELLNHKYQEKELGDEYCLRIFEFAKGIPGVTYYDAAYHVLAFEMNRTLVTADEKYFKKISRKGHILFIGDWEI